jgi:hypothetical protein
MFSPIRHTRLTPDNIFTIPQIAEQSQQLELATFHLDSSNECSTTSFQSTGVFTQFGLTEGEARITSHLGYRRPFAGITEAS